MLAQQFIFSLILISGAFAVLTEEDHLKLDFKRELVLSEYINYWNEIAVVNEAQEVVDFRDVQPTKKQVLAQLFERVVASNLSIIVRGCSIHYSRFPEEENPNRSVGCTQFANYLAWYNENQRAASFFDKNPIEVRNPFDYNVQKLVEDIDFILEDVRRMDEIFRLANQNFNDIFQRLQYASHGTIPAYEGFPIEVRNDGDAQDRENHYKEVLRRLGKFFGERMLRVHNYFNGFFQVELINDVRDLVPTLAFIQHYFRKIRFIDGNTEFAQTQTNVNLIFETESYLFLGLMDKAEMKENRPSNSWDYQSQIMRHSDYVFQYT